MDLRLDRDPYRWDRPDRPSEPWRGPHEPPAGSGAGLSPWLEERLFDRRVIMVSGPLTAGVATRTAAALFTLDGAGAEPIQLHLASPDGELTAAFTVVDALDAVAAPVCAVVTAEVGGAAVLLLAAASKRSAYRHARVRLCEPRAAGVTGTADEVAAAAGRYLRELEELAVRIADASGQPRSRVEDDLGAGRVLTAEQAKEYGLVDEIVGGKPAGG